MKRWAVTAALAAPLAAAALAAPRLAAAEPRKLLVLQSEGRADAATRAKIDAAITRLAASAEPGTSPGELSYSDAATAVGCRPEAPSCKDDVIGMLAVDEIVITRVTPKPGGLEIAVQRVARGGAARDATMLLPTGAPADRLDGIAPRFNDKLASRGAVPIGPPPAPAPDRPGSSGSADTPAAGGADPASITQPGTPSGTPGAASGETAPVIPAPNTVAPPPRAIPETSPPPAAVDSSARNRKLELGGMIGGGSAVLLGVLLWGAANSTQHDIDAAPTRTQKDLSDLRDLESRGDAQATVGNVLVITGAIVGGVATYFFLRDRRAATTTARLAPAVMPHGAGVVLSFGGPP